MNIKKIIIIAISIIVAIAIIICFCIALYNTNNSDSENKISSISGGTITNVDSTEVVNITEGGSYNLSGNYESIVINTTQDVELDLNGVTITNTNGPAINVENAGKVSIVLTGANTLTVTTTEELDGAIYSKDDLVFSGAGSLEIKSNYHGIVSKDSIEINGGTYTIDAGKDGINTNDETIINAGTFTITGKSDGFHTDGYIEINDGTFTISAAEGIEATNIKINGGNINISASDDGINASEKSTDYKVSVEINGGNLTIKMGQGDTDAIDTNGDLYINGGTLNITAQSPFDYDGTAEHNGGTIIVNGEETDEITNQFDGGQMNGGPNGRNG